MDEPGDEVTTIRVGGIPAHTTEAEFNCWFLCAPGFEQGTLSAPRPGSPQLGWARFDSAEAAQWAISQLSGKTLTPYQSPEGLTLNAEFAKGNFRTAKPTNKRPHPESTEQWWAEASAVGAPATPRPSTTLFIRNLLDDCSEEELQHFFGGLCEGFERLKYVPGGGGKLGMCFAKFCSLEHAEAAFQVIGQGLYALPSDPETAVQAEFAKNDLDVPGKAGGYVGGGAPAAAAPSGHLEMTAQHHVAATPSRRAAPPPARQESAHEGTCDTMYVGGLPSGTAELEVRGVLATMPGFVRMKFNPGVKPIAFVLFDSAASCWDAIQTLTGSGWNCQFAKNSLDQPSKKSYVGPGGEGFLGGVVC